jgi:hypothetical protein
MAHLVGQLLTLPAFQRVMNACHESVAGAQQAIVKLPAA